MYRIETVQALDYKDDFGFVGVFVHRIKFGRSIISKDFDGDGDYQEEVFGGCRNSH